MLRRVVVPALAASLTLGLSPAVPAAAQQGGRRVVVVTVDGTSVEDWARAGVFGSLGSAGLLGTRTATDADFEHPVLLRAAAYTTIGAGSAAELDSTAARTDAGRGVLAGALGEALERRGLEAAGIGDADGEDVRDGPASRAVMRADGSIAFPPADQSQPAAAVEPRSKRDPASPAGFRTDLDVVKEALHRALGWASVVVVDLGDTERADRTFPRSPLSRARWIDRALREAEGFVRDARAMLEPGDTLIVASLVPPLDRVRRSVHLTAVAMTGEPGALTSGTTRRDGVVSLTDLGPTILTRAGVAVPDEMTGRAVRVERSTTPLADALRRDAEYVYAHGARRPVTRVWLFGAAAIATLAFLIVAAGRGRSAGRRFPTTYRDVLVTFLDAAAAVPAAVLVAPVLPGASAAAIGWWTLGLSFGGALVVRAGFGNRAALPVIALLDVALVTIDLLAGSPLAAKSPLGFQVAGGGRFYGIDEGLLGVMMAGALVATAAWLDGRFRPRRMIVAAVPLAAVAFVASAPTWGSKFGASFTLAPAFGVLLVLAYGRRLDRVAVTAIGIATVLLTASLAAADALATPAARSHIGREVAGQSDVIALVFRKLGSLVEITATTIWLPVSVVIAIPIVLFLVRRRNLLARAFWGTPARRAALVAGSVGFLTAMASNDTGIIVVAPALVVGAAAFYGPLLSPHQVGGGRARDV